MANLKQLLQINQMSYTALKDINSIQAKVDSYELVDYQFDKESNHGGIAYYNPIDKSVIIANRGSATKIDWLKNNPQILFERFGKPRETMADVAAKRFANNILERLDRENNDIKQIHTTGHSKGGRESCAALVEIADNLKLDVSCLTFNAAPFKNPTGKEYNHLNLQLSGGGILNTDIVSVLGKQLGTNYKIISPEIHNPISAHSLNNFEHIIKAYPQLANDDLSKTFYYLKENNRADEYGKDLIFSNQEQEQKKISIVVPEMPNAKVDKVHVDIQKIIEAEKIVDNDNIKGDKVFDAAITLADEKEKLAEKMLAALKEKNTGLWVIKDNETVALSPSAKEQDKWQVTYFDKNMIAKADSGNQKADDAVNTFLNSFRFNEIGINEVNKVLEFSGEPKMQQKQTYLNESIDDLKLVRVVKDIENYQKEGDSLMMNKNPNTGESIRNTTHFTLNAVVNDHAYGKFSESKYAIIADLQDTAKENKVHGVSAADTWFWNENGGIKVNNPVMVMPENDKNIEKYEKDFQIVQYKPSDNAEENYNNLKDAVKNHFEAEKLPFYQVGMWGWSNGGHGMVQEHDQRAISEALGAKEILPSVHNGSIDERMEQLNSVILADGKALEKAELRDDFLKIEPLSSDVLKQVMQGLKENREYAYDYYSQTVGQKLEDFNQQYQDKKGIFDKQFNERIDALEAFFDKANIPFPDGSMDRIMADYRISFDDKNNLSVMPPPAPPEMQQLDKLGQFNVIEQQRGTDMPVPQGNSTAIPPPLPQQLNEVLTGIDTLKNNGLNNEKPFTNDYYKESISKSLADKLYDINPNHFKDDFTGTKEKKFFIDPENAVHFFKENHKDIQQMLELHSKHTGYETTKEFVKDNPYFKDIEQEKMEKALQDANGGKELNGAYSAMAAYTADSLVQDYDYFKDMQQNVQESYSSAEMYIFLSDENSQSIFIKDNMFMDDEKSEMGAELDAKVFDRVEQVENFLEANESILQSKINKINVIDTRSNPNISTIKGLAQGKLNHLRGEISELKTFDSAHAMPLGEAKNHVIMVDANGENLFSVSKGKLVGHNIDIDDIIKSHTKVELFNNGKNIEVKSLENAGIEKQKTQDKAKDKGMELDI